MYTGLSKRTLYKLTHGDDVPDPQELGRRSREIEMTREEEARIRPVIVDLVKRKITPTLYSIHQTLSASEESWKWSSSSLYRAMLRIGFKFTRRKNLYYARLQESEENVLLRMRYLSNDRGLYNLINIEL